MERTHTEKQSDTCAVFLLAHPDDDIFIRPLMRRSIDENLRCVVIILTNATAQKGRKRELLNAISIFCAINDVHFIGETLTVEDKSAIFHLNSLNTAVQRVLKNLPKIHRLVTHAWEMGHPDHDAAHLVGKAVALNNNIPEALSTTYYRKGSRPWLLSVQAPQLSSRPVRTLQLSWHERLDMLAAVRFYPSQMKTFMGLLPFMLLRAVSGSGLYIQDLRDSDAPRLPEDTTIGLSMTESRFDVTPEVIARCARAFLEQFETPSSNSTGHNR